MNTASGDIPFFIHTGHIPLGWLATGPSSFCRHPLKNEIWRVQSLNVGTSKKFVRRVKILWASLKKMQTLLFENLSSLGEGFGYKDGMSPGQKCKWPVKVEHENKTVARGTMGEPYNDLYGKALPKRGAYFRLQVYKRGWSIFQSLRGPKGLRDAYYCCS